jgi:hypothetical protein
MTLLAPTQILIVVGRSIILGSDAFLIIESV